MENAIHLAEDAKVEACADHVGVEDAVTQEDHEQLALVRVPVVPATLRENQKRLRPPAKFQLITIHLHVSIKFESSAIQFNAIPGSIPTTHISLHNNKIHSHSKVTYQIGITSIQVGKAIRCTTSLNTCSGRSLPSY
jgi:hypothetical protein